MAFISFISLIDLRRSSEVSLFPPYHLLGEEMFRVLLLSFHAMERLTVSYLSLPYFTISHRSTQIIGG
jgi:hypothetical protein